MDQCDKIEITKKRPQTKWSYCKIVVLSILQSAVGRSVTAPTETNTDQLRNTYSLSRFSYCKIANHRFCGAFTVFFNNLGLLIFSTADMQHEILLGSYSLMQMTRTCILNVSFDTILPTTGVSATSHAGCLHGLIYTWTGSPVIINYFVFVLCVICPFWFHSVHFSAHVTCTVQSRLSDYHVVLYYRK